MSPETVALVLGLVMVLVPLLGNPLVLFLRSRGHVRAADHVARIIPFAYAAASSRTREELIRNLVEEGLKAHAGAADRDRLVAIAVELATKRKPASASRMPPMPVFLLALFCASCVPILGCTPQQARDAREGMRTKGAPSAKITGAVCEKVADVVGGDAGAFVDFACTIVNAIGGAFENLDTEGGPEIRRPAGPPVKFIIRVPAEEAESFELEHRASL